MTLTRSKPLKRTPLKRSSTKPKRKTSWRSIKRDPLDILWSKVVRARDKHTCQAPISWRMKQKYENVPDYVSTVACGRRAPEWQIDAAHIFSRRKKTTRWNPINGLSLCKVCHDWAHRNEQAFRAWARVRLENYFDMLELTSRGTAKVDRDEVRSRLRAMLREYEGDQRA